MKSLGASPIYTLVYIGKNFITVFEATYKNKKIEILKEKRLFLEDLTICFKNESAEIFSKKLKEIFENYNFSKKNIITLIPDEYAYIKYIRIPYTQNFFELDYNIKTEFNNIIPHGLDNVYYDYVLSKCEDDENFLIAKIFVIKKHIFDFYTNIFKNANINLKSVGIESVSLFNFINFFYNKEKLDDFIFCIYSNNLLTINVFKENLIYLSESYYLNENFLEDNELILDTLNGIKCDIKDKILVKLNENKDINLINSNNDAQFFSFIKKIIIYSDSDEKLKIKRTIQDTFKRGASFLNLREKFDEVYLENCNKVKLSLNLLYNFKLLGVFNNRKNLKNPILFKQNHINFLDNFESINFQINNLLKKIFVFLSIYFSICLLFLCIFIKDGAFLNNEKNEKEKFLSSLLVKAKDIKNINKENEKILSKINKVRKIQDNKYIFLKVLDRLNLIIPKRIWVTSLNIKKDNLIIQGKAFDEKAIAKFIKRIEKQDCFTSAVLKFSKSETYKKVKINAFEIIAKIKI